MAKWAMAAGLAAVLGAGEAAAQDDGETSAGGVSITAENDLFVPGDNTDRYYTQGMKATWLIGDQHQGLLRAVVDPIIPSNWTVRATLGVGQHMYTPEDKSLTVPDPDDRPYAGWLYVSTSTAAYDDDQILGAELQIGIVGPDAHAGPLQNWWHTVIGAPSVNGWASQLNNELGVNLHLEYRHRLSTPDLEGWGADAIGVVTAAAGNVEVSAGAWVVTRIGLNLGDDFGPPRLRPGAASTEFFVGRRWAVYAFAGVYGRVIGRDIFLDGNTFEDSAFVERETWVPEYTWGFAVRTPTWRISDGWRLPPMRIGYPYVERENEFVGQLAPSRFGAINVTILGNGMRPWIRPH